MNILVVGNVLKDVYLNLDSRTEKFETDKSGTDWLDLSFNASEHHFFNRGSSFGGAAITLEVLKKMGLDASIADNSITFTNNDFKAQNPTEVHRYILVSDNGVSYLAPSSFKLTIFNPPSTSYDYLFIDRSAELNSETARKINAYLEQSRETKLILYLRNLENQHSNSLIKRADLVFIEKSSTSVSEQTHAPESPEIPPEKTIYLTENSISYLAIHEQLSIEHVDKMTHLSMYSIAAATIVGSFILGESVEKSLQMARANVENSRLDSVLSLDELKELIARHNSKNDIELIAANLVLASKGILAADESGGSIHKKFEQLGIDDTYENRRDYRNILLATPNLDKYINGVILFDETTHQLADDGQNYVDFLTAHRIIPGIKVDQGLAQFDNSEETYTKGLDDLDQRLKSYYNTGLRFAKWRAAFAIRLNKKGDIITPTNMAIQENCRILAEYAKKCQSIGLVPIVEPEVVYDGNYDLDQSSFITSKILDCLFNKLEESGVNLHACILKINMVLAGKQYSAQSTPDEVGLATAKTLKSHVPESLAGIVFLSGGQTTDQATANLSAIIANGPYPWPVTFSFARALQDPALFAWAGDNHNTEKARQAFLDRLIANTDALK